MERDESAIIRQVVLRHEQSVSLPQSDQQRQRVHQLIEQTTTRWSILCQHAEQLALGDTLDELRVLDLLNFRLRCQGRDPGTAGFENATRQTCCELLQTHCKLSGEHVPAVARFLVDHCDLDFLELCDDFFFDPTDFGDDGEEQYGHAFQRLAQFATCLLQPPTIAGDDAPEAANPNNVSSLAASLWADTNLSSLALGLRDLSLIHI